MTAERGPRFVLALSMFITGACGLVAQYILSTVSTYILGNSIEQFSIIIALTLLMMGIAGVVQRSISDHALVEKFVATEIAIGVLCGFTPLALYAAYALLFDHFVLIQYAFILSVGFLIGLEIPLAIRINERYAASLKSNIANIWALDYIGAFVGALVWAFVLIRNFPLTELSFYVGALNIVVAAVTFVYFARRGHAAYGRWAGAALVIATVGMGWGWSQNRPWSLQLEQQLYDDRIVFATTTQYQRIVVTESPNQKDTRLFLNGNLQFASVDELIYHEQLVHPAMSLVPSRAKVLVLGGGDGLAVREIRKYPDVESITLVDLDPAMIDLARTNPVLRRLNEASLDDARVRAEVSAGVQATGKKRDVWQEKSEPSGRPGLRDTQAVATVDVFTVDASLFAGSGSDRFNVIIVDLPDPSSVELAKLYSREFYAGLARRLAADGVMVVQSTSPFHAKEAFLCIGRTLRSAGFSTMPYHDNVPTFGDWGWWMATSRPLPEDRLASVQLTVPTRYLTPTVFQRSRAFGRDWLNTRQTDVSTLLEPRVMNHYLGSGWRID
jgi:spermidine synthase